MSSELIVIERKNVLSVFTEDGNIDPILQKIASEARSFVPDVSTAGGRKNIASMAYKVAQTKTYLDGLGKDLVTEMKELPKKVDSSRKSVRDFLDALRDEIRKPLDDWEEEQERIAAEKKAEEEAAALAEQVARDHEMALLMNAEFNRQADASRAAAEAERIEYERKIAEQAAERARIEAEERAKAEKEAAERKVIEAQLAAERAERQRLEELEAADRRAKEAAERAEFEKNQAIENERRRIQQEAEEELKKTEAREADKNHRRKINRAALDALIENTGLSDDKAELVIKAIAVGLIPNVKINY